MLIEPNGKFQIVQSNTLITACYRMKVNQMKMAYMAISFVQQGDSQFNNMRVKVKDIIKIFGLKSGQNMYTRIQKELVEMKSHVVKIENDKEYILLSWFDKIHYNKSDGSIEFVISKDLEPYLLGLDGNFTSKILEQIMCFQGFFTIRIYGLLKEYEDFKTERTIRIDDLKKMLSMPKERYSIYAEFKRNVILPAQKELNSKDKDGFYISDLGFDFEQIKTGRKVTAIKFIIRKNKSQKLIETGTKDDNRRSLLSNYGVKEPNLTILSKNYPIDEIKKSIEIAERKAKKEKIDNIAGLIIVILESGGGKKSQKEIEEENKKIAEENKMKERELAEQKSKIAREFQAKRVAEFIESLSESEKESLTSEVLKAHKGNLFNTELIKSTGFNSPIARVEVEKHIPNYEEEKEAYIKSKL